MENGNVEQTWNLVMGNQSSETIHKLRTAMVYYCHEYRDIVNVFSHTIQTDRTIHQVVQKKK